MNVSLDELNRWAQRLADANRMLLHGMRSGEVDIYTLQEKLNSVFQGVKRAGADDPYFVNEPKEFQPKETPLELLNTPAVRRYIAALREAAEAGKEVDRERDADGAYSEWLEDYALGMEFEAFGPVELRGE